MAVGLALSAPLTGHAGPASASPHPTLQAAGRYHFDLPDHGDEEVLSTYLFGQTAICVNNVGSLQGKATITTEFSDTTTLQLAPGERKCDSGNYWGGAVWVKNTGYSPLHGDSGRYEQKPTVEGR